jgi:S1-C subfamily serine protease
MRLWFVLLAFAASSLTIGVLPEWRNQGVYVESVLKNSAGDSAGLRPGDIIRNWSRAAAKGHIQSPFDLMEIETEQSP